MVALRGPHRWVQTYVPVRIPEGIGDAPLAAAGRVSDYRRPRRHRVGAGGVLGGALPGSAGVGGTLAAAPACGVARVVAAHGARGHWTTGSSGAGVEAPRDEVLVVQADVADAGQMRAGGGASPRPVWRSARCVPCRWGAGVGLMQLKSAETAAAVLRPKVQGTLALGQAVADLPLDFLVLFSSVTSANGGGPGQVDYCAANAFMDTYARCMPRRMGRRSRSVGGSGSGTPGRRVLGYPEEARAEIIRNRQTYGLSFTEGAEALRRFSPVALPCLRHHPRPAGNGRGHGKRHRQQDVPEASGVA